MEPELQDQKERFFMLSLKSINKQSNNIKKKIRCQFQVYIFDYTDDSKAALSQFGNVRTTIQNFEVHFQLSAFAKITS